MLYISLVKLAGSNYIWFCSRIKHPSIFSVNHRFCGCSFIWSNFITPLKIALLNYETISSWIWISFSMIPYFLPLMFCKLLWNLTSTAILSVALNCYMVHFCCKWRTNNCSFFFFWQDVIIFLKTVIIYLPFTNYIETFWNLFYTELELQISHVCHNKNN